MTPADPPSRFAADRERLASLARLISPVVHRVNNSLAVLRGACDLMLQQTPSDHLLRACEETSRIADTLALLSTCTKTHTPVTGPFDLATAMRNAALLIDVLSSTHAVEVVDRCGSGESIPVCGDRLRLEQLLVWFVAEAAVRRVPGMATNKVRFRLSLRPARAGVAISILRQAPADQEAPGSTASLEAARELGTRGDLSVRTGSRFGGVTYLRFVFPVSGPLPEFVIPKRAVHRPRVLLVERDTPRRGLVHTVLEERGYRVEIPTCEAPGTEELLRNDVDLLLLDAREVEAREGFLAEVQRAAAASGSVRVAILGRTPHADENDDVPRLADPFRPGELLDFVAAQLR